MTRFSDTMGAQAWDVLKLHHGLSCTYTDATDASTDTGVLMVFRDRGSSTDTNFGTFLFEEADITNATVKRGDTITAPNSVVWVITDVTDRGLLTNFAQVEVEHAIARA